MPRSRLFSTRALQALTLAAVVSAAGVATANAGSLDYTPYSRTGRFNVSWKALGAMSISVYRSANGGAWTLIYHDASDPGPDPDPGPGPQARPQQQLLPLPDPDPSPSPSPNPNPQPLTDGSVWVGPLPDGSHRFKITRCNQAGNCNDQTGDSMTVRRPPAVDIVTQHPEVANARSRSEAYQARTRPFTADQESHWLGQGWDTLSGKIKKLCLDLDATPTMVTTPVRQERLAVDIAENEQELAQLMRIDFSANLAIRYMKFAAETDVKTSVYHETKMRRQSSVIVAQWSYTDENWQLAARTAPLHPEYQALLNPDSGSRNPVNFNQDCGDEIVWNVNLGARAFLIVTFNHTTMTEATLRQTSANVRARFEQVLNGGASSTWSSDDRSYFNSIGIQIRTYAEGGPSGILSGGLLAPDTALSKFHQFIAASSPDTYVAIDKGHDRYELPSPWLSRPYYTVFTDPRPAFQKLSRWLNADLQTGGRCNDLEISDTELSATTYTPRCFAAKRDLMFEIDDCANSILWDSCVDPAGHAILTNIHERIPAMDPVVVESSIDHYVGSRLSKRCQSASAEARLADRACIADKTRSEGLEDVCLSGNHAAPGYGIYVESCYSPASGGGASHVLRRDYSTASNGAYALFSSVTVCAERLYGHNAWYKGTQDLYAKCPVYRPVELE